MKKLNAVEEIKEKVDIVDIISKDIKLEKVNGDYYKGFCPFHDEKTPSFTVHKKKQIFHCFGCGKGGDVFSFMMQHYGFSFKEAFLLLSKNAGINQEEELIEPILEERINEIQNLLSDTPEVRELIEGCFIIMKGLSKKKRLIYLNKLCDVTNVDNNFVHDILSGKLQDK